MAKGHVEVGNEPHGRNTSQRSRHRERPPADDVEVLCDVEHGIPVVLGRRAGSPAPDVAGQELLAVNQADPDTAQPIDPHAPRWQLESDLVHPSHGNPGSNGSPDGTGVDVHQVHVQTGDLLHGEHAERANGDDTSNVEVSRSTSSKRHRQNRAVDGGDDEARGGAGGIPDGPCPVRPDTLLAPWVSDPAPAWEVHVEEYRVVDAVVPDDPLLGLKQPVLVSVGVLMGGRIGNLPDNDGDAVDAAIVEHPGDRHYEPLGAVVGNVERPPLELARLECGLDSGRLEAESPLHVNRSMVGEVIPHGDVYRPGESCPGELQRRTGLIHPAVEILQEIEQINRLEVNAHAQKSLRATRSDSLANTAPPPAWLSGWAVMFA